MKVKYTNGCICDSLTIDDNETVDMELNEIRDITCKLYDRYADDNETFERAITDYIDQGDYPQCDDEDVVIANRNIVIGGKEIKLKHTYIRLDEYIHIDNDAGNEIPHAELKKFGYECLKLQTDTASLQGMIIEIIEKHGLYEYIGHCDCCGDTIVEYTLTI